MNAGREGLARSVQARLVRHAGAIGVDPNLILARYAVERFLYRLSCSPHADRFVLKGAMLLLFWLGETLRPTRDADLLGFGELSDASLQRIFVDVCDVEVEADAMSYLAETIEVTPIRLEDEYGGRRVALRARLGSARIPVQIDVGIGDAVTPAPIVVDYPALLDLPGPRLRAYPRETVIAEKLHAIVALGQANSRMKDYFDLRALLRERAYDPKVLERAVAATFERRRTTPPAALPAGLTDAFALDTQKRAQWQAFLRRNRLDDAARLEDVIAEIREPLSAALAGAIKAAPV